MDQQNIKWIGTGSKGLVKYDNVNWTVYDTSNSDLPGNIVIDEKYNKWIGTDDGGANIGKKLFFS